MAFTPLWISVTFFPDTGTSNNKNKLHFTTLNVWTVIITNYDFARFNESNNKNFQLNFEKESTLDEAATPATLPLRYVAIPCREQVLHLESNCNTCYIASDAPADKGSVRNSFVKYFVFLSVLPSRKNPTKSCQLFQRYSYTCRNCTFYHVFNPSKILFKLTHLG